MTILVIRCLLFVVLNEYSVTGFHLCVGFFISFLISRG